MSLSLAVKRSFPYFVPAAVLHPRKVLTKLFVPYAIFVMGISYGSVLTLSRSPEAMTRIFQNISWSLVLLSLLLSATKWRKPSMSSSEE